MLLQEINNYKAWCSDHHLKENDAKNLKKYIDACYINTLEDQRQASMEGGF